jgi:hypothetical protein
MGVHLHLLLLRAHETRVQCIGLDVGIKVLGLKIGADVGANTLGARKSDEIG